MKSHLFGLILTFIAIGTLACGGSDGSQTSPVTEEKTAVLDTVNSTPTVRPTIKAMDNTQESGEKEEGKVEHKLE